MTDINNWTTCLLVGVGQVVLFGLQRDQPTLGGERLVLQRGLLPLLVLQLQLQVPHRVLVGAEVALRVRVGTVGLIQADLQVVDVAFQLLLGPEQLGPAPAFRFQAGLNKTVTSTRSLHIYYSPFIVTVDFCTVSFVTQQNNGNIFIAQKMDDQMVSPLMSIR